MTHLERYIQSLDGLPLEMHRLMYLCLDLDGKFEKSKTALDAVYNTVLQKANTPSEASNNAHMPPDPPSTSERKTKKNSKTNATARSKAAKKTPEVPFQITTKDLDDVRKRQRVVHGFALEKLAVVKAAQITLDSFISSLDGEIERFEARNPNIVQLAQEFTTEPPEAEHEEEVSDMSTSEESSSYSDYYRGGSSSLQRSDSVAIYNSGAGGGGGSQTAARIYCICKRHIEGEEMVGCDGGDECEDEWFHLSCVGLTQAPPKDVEWYCDKCRKRLGKKR